MCPLLLIVRSLALISLSPQLARQLVRLNFPKVCVLYGGAGVLRSIGLLSSIQDDP